MNSNRNFAHSIEEWLHESLGVDPGMTQVVKVVLLFVVMIVLAVVVWLIAQWFINRFFSRLVKRTASKWDDSLEQQGTFRKLGHIVPAVLISVLTPLVFADYPIAIPYIEKLMTIFVMLVIIRVIVSAITGTGLFLSESPKFKDKPIASFAQLANLVIWFVGIILVLSPILGQNPIYMFSALGAVSAVLLLIFKDTILGFTASIQLTINDMVRINDWVAMPKYGADGDVVEINLTTVKIRNWDKTISTVPTYAFVSDSFVNWRGMQESGGRRIKRSISLKMNRVRFCNDADLEEFSKIQRVRDHIERRKQVIAEYNREHEIDSEASLVNGRRMTNLGIFRAYILQYLKDNPSINHDMTCMVRQLQPTELGVPLEIYCFTASVAWLVYEDVQSDIFDHILAAVEHFDLEVFENPAGSDFGDPGLGLSGDAPVGAVQPSQDAKAKDEGKE